MKRQKIKKPIIDGIQFDSDLEGFIYSHIKENKIHTLPGLEELKGMKLIDARCESYEILPSMKFGKKVFRALHYTPDFIVKTGKDVVVLEIKSKWTASKADYKLRVKFFLSLYGGKLKFAELIQHNKKKYEYIKYYN